MRLFGSSTVIPSVALLHAGDYSIFSKFKAGCCGAAVIPRVACSVWEIDLRRRATMDK